MPGVDGAVGPAQVLRIPLMVEDVDRRVDALENEMRLQGADLHSAVNELTKLIGSPGSKADGSEATGLYDLAHSLNTRLKPFEKLYYEVRGGMKAGVPLLLGSAGLVWWLGGDKISHFFHG